MKISYKTKIILIALALIIAVAPTASCNSAEKGGNKEMENLNDFDEKNQVVVMEISEKGTIVLEMYPDQAPVTVNNFLGLVKEGFYEDIIFHRIIENFMIQGGDPTGTGMGGSEVKIKGEFRENNVDNNISHDRGVISMARSLDKNSASSQFFIVHKDSHHLDGSYAAFGKVIEGLDVLDKIASLETGDSDRPLTPPVIKSVRIEDRK